MTQNVFALFEEDPVVAELKNIKSKLLILIIQKVRTQELSQSQVSEIAGITQPRVSNLMKGYLHKFSIDMLISVALKLDAVAEVDYHPTDSVFTFQLGSL